MYSKKKCLLHAFTIIFQLIAALKNNILHVSRESLYRKEET